MDSHTLPAFLQTHLLECRFLANPDRYPAAEKYKLRNQTPSFKLTPEEQKDASLLTAVLHTDERAVESDLTAVEQARDRFLAEAKDAARKAGAALASGEVGRGETGARSSLTSSTFSSFVQQAAQRRDVLQRNSLRPINGAAQQRPAPAPQQQRVSP